jgi:hypothetical protein
MSDTKLRDLERRWKETGTVDDEAAYLLERVRVGDLGRERLELAAYCGHEGASRASPHATRHPSGESLQSMSHAIASRWGAEPVARMLVCLARIAAPVWIDTFPEDRRPLDALDAIEDHLACPCAAHAEVMERAQRQASAAAHAVYETHSREAVVALAVSNAAQYLEGKGVMGTSIKQLTGFLGDLYRREAVWNELIPWALGRPDPVFERVRCRQDPAPP